MGNAEVLPKEQHFARELSQILSRCSVLPGKALRWTIITNPTAEGFTINKRWKNHKQTLQAAVAKARANPERKNVSPSQTAL